MCTAPIGWPQTPSWKAWSLLVGLRVGLGHAAAADLRRRIAATRTHRSVVPALQQAMSRHAGGLRDAAGLDRCVRELAKLARLTGAEPGLESWEATNLMTAAAVVASARLREESRGLIGVMISKTVAKSGVATFLSNTMISKVGITSCQPR